MDHVVIGAPLVVDADFIAAHGIHAVVHGEFPLDGLVADPYAAPKALGAYKDITIDGALMTYDIVDRIIANQWGFYVTPWAA